MWDPSAHPVVHWVAKLNSLAGWAAPLRGERRGVGGGLGIELSSLALNIVRALDDSFFFC
jgi:hypothetical protein